ncbi:2Fe-2S iron-sulfur cluster-binding protein [Microcoleus sp. herbarium7]|uniref:2Fe-2S iron-sulfur cluster-binding protein n=1 Tax=Microcoleus sp. herbarium7 TaxID=3055435 RepID=UPI002FCECB8A
MVKVQAQGKTFECDRGANLREVLLKNGIELYNGSAKIINCHALGTCGTCAVSVEGEVSESQWREKARLSVPPHSLASNRRLSCQTKVLGDIKVTKYDGFWGQGSEIVWKPIA